MRDETPFRNAIRSACPDLTIETARLLDSTGQNNDLLLVNDELIFRFPKYAQGVETLLREVAILAAIQSRVSLPVPNPIYRSESARKVGEAFIGYPMIPGEPIWRETLSTLSQLSDRRRLAHQLGHFLQELHQIPIENLCDAGPYAGTADQWRELFGEIQLHLYPHMRSDAREEVFRLFTGFLDDPRMQSFIPALRHGDFGTGNILFDARSRAITGIIDFSGTAIGDPAVDFAALLCYGDDFTLQVAEVYPEAEPLLQRAHFYVGTFALQEALHGLHHGDAEAFQSGIARYSEQSE